MNADRIIDKSPNVPKKTTQDEEVADDVVILRTTIDGGFLEESEGSEDVVTDPDNYFGSPDDVPQALCVLNRNGIEIVQIKEKLEGGKERLREFYRTKEGLHYPIGFPPIAPRGYESVWVTKFLKLEGDTKFQDAYEGALKKSMVALAAEKRRAGKIDKLLLMGEKEVMFLNERTLMYRLIMEQIIVWEESYLKRETAFILIDDELHPVDTPHPKLIKHPAYEGLFKGVIDEQLRRVRLIIQSITPSDSKHV